MAALRLISDLCHAALPVRVKTYRDAEWNEYRSVLFIHGARVDGATNFTSDRADALDTAAHMLKHAAQRLRLPIAPCELARAEMERAAPSPYGSIEAIDARSGLRASVAAAYARTYGKVN